MQGMGRTLSGGGVWGGVSAPQRLGCGVSYRGPRKTALLRWGSAWGLEGFQDEQCFEKHGCEGKKKLPASSHIPLSPTKLQTNPLPSHK